MPFAFRATAALMLLGALASCRPDNKIGDSGADECEGPSLSTPPDDQSVVFGSPVTLTVAGEVCADDESPEYHWTIESVPVDSTVTTDSLDVSDPTNVRFMPDVVGTYVLSIYVSDTAGALSAVDFVTVTVSTTDSAPIANCGGNLTGEENERVDLDGSGSSDPEGAALTYQWTLSSTPDCSNLESGTDNIFNGTSVSPSVVPDCAGVFVVALAVNDGAQWSDPAFCSITVDSGNESPTADAGDSTTLSPCTERNFELDGYGSWDPEGVELGYLWTLLEAPSGSSCDDSCLSDTTVANPVVRWDVTGAWTFQLQVFDGEAWSAPDVVTYTFQDEDENYPPVANAGDDATVDTETECETASYVFTCDDCDAEEVDLDGSASDDPRDGDELDFTWSDASGELTIESAHSAVTTASTPPFASTYGSATTRVWEVELTVSDCADSDTDSMTITYTCEGTYSP